MARITTETIARAIWSCAASDLCAREARRVGGKDVYPDPNGNCVAVCDYTGTEVRGWHAARLAGDEMVALHDEGNVIRFEATDFVLARIGNCVSGREAKRLRAGLR